MSNRIFHTANVGGYLFEGVLSGDGPYISCEQARGGVALGVCGLRKFSPTDLGGREMAAGWWVVKYSNEARIDLHGFSDDQAKKLSDEFGIVILKGHPWPNERVRQEYFFTSPAWEGLRDWVKRHPRIASTAAACQSYLFNWYERSRAE